MCCGRGGDRERLPIAETPDYSQRRRVLRTADPRVFRGGSWTHGEFGDSGSDDDEMRWDARVRIDVVPRGLHDRFPPCVLVGAHADGFSFVVIVFDRRVRGKTNSGVVVEHPNDYRLLPGEYIVFDGGVRLDFATNTVPFAELKTQSAVQVAPAPRVAAPREAPDTVLPAPEVQKADDAARRREQFERERAAAEAASLDAMMDAALARVTTGVAAQQVGGKARVRG